MKWLCILMVCLDCLRAPAFAAEPTAAPASRPSSLVPLDVKLPKRGWDGQWMHFDRWRRERPEAEDCTLELAPFLVPHGTRNLALRRPVTSSDPEPTIGDLKQITDGNKEGTEDARVELMHGLQWVQIDLGRPCRLHAILVWHSAAFPGLYKDVIVQLSDGERFEKGVRTIFNNDRDNSSGLGRGTDREYFQAVGTRIIDAHGFAARYVRLYSNGNLLDDQNHYVEVEIHGLDGEER